MPRLTAIDPATATGEARELLEGVRKKRGFVSDDDLAAVRAAGHDDGAIAEIVANLAANVFTNYLNHVAETDVDVPRVDLAQAEAA